ncbi:stage V sporulation protein AE [Bacillus pacificus]
MKKACKYVAMHKTNWDVLGILAVASNTTSLGMGTCGSSAWIETGNLTEYGVDKFGLPDGEIGRISGDTNLLSR